MASENLHLTPISDPNFPAGNPLAQARLNRRGQPRIAQIDLEQAASAQCWVGQPRLAQQAVQVGQRIVQLRARALA